MLYNWLFSKLGKERWMMQKEFTSWYCLVLFVALVALWIYWFLPVAIDLYMRLKEGRKVDYAWLKSVMDKVVCLLYGYVIVYAINFQFKLF
jgi:hypothetical protein